MNKIEEQLKKIKSEWFFKNPLLFSVVCSHSLTQNDNLLVPMRCGNMQIEFSPVLLESLSKNQIEQYLKVEAFRILLGHPYKRQPYNSQKQILLLASDVTIYNLLKNELNEIKLTGVEYLKSQAGKFSILDSPLGKEWDNTEELKFFQRNLLLNHANGELELLDDLTFEQWYKKIYFLISKTSCGGENAGSSIGDFIYSTDGADLWEENEEALDNINDEIQKAEIENGFGEIGGKTQRVLKEGCDFSFDYRKALTQFRANIISNSRKLTRMRPSRRYGFKAMGSRYERKAKILIAVDVSGSITDESFEHFCHAIKNFFFLGIIEKIDLIFFDVNLKNTEPVSFNKKFKLDQIKGRGGTNFQPPLDYFSEHQTEYNGLIIFTDGEGEIPKIRTSTKSILWILDSRVAFSNNFQWINNVLGCKATYLPF